MKNQLASSLLLASCFSLAACSDDAEEIELTGNWDTNFGTQEMIDSSAWGATTVVFFDNDKNFAITQNADDAEFSPGKFSKLVWTDLVDQSYWYCTADFGKDTAEQAENTSNTPDASDPANGGCNDFGWTKLTPTAQ